MLNVIKLLILFNLVFFILTNCTYRTAFGSCAYRAKTGECYQKVTQDADIKITSYTAADNLIRHAPPAQSKKYRLLVTSIANIDNLEDSTSLGRLIGEQLSARFAQQDYAVIEAKLQRNLRKIPRTGEFTLSRQERDMGKAQFADRVVAGTYAVGKDKVYVTLKMLNYRNGEVMSSYAYSLPIGPNTAALLQKSFWW